MKRVLSLLLISCVLIAFSPTLAANSFSDVPADVWYANYVNFVTERGIFNGTSATNFSPANNMTRGMFVTVLGRYAGIPASESGNPGVITKDSVNMRSEPNTDSKIVAVFDKNTSVQITGLSTNWYHIQYGSKTGYVRADLMEPCVSCFSDVSASMYYSSYIEWAYSKNIASGTSGTTFSPDVNITREEICSMLSNYATSVNLRINAIYDKQNFKDDAKIQTRTKDAVYAMQQAGIVNGREDGSFAPSEYASRAEVAAIFTRFVDTVGYKAEPTPQFSEDGSYTFGTAVPTTEAVADSYFNDAVFIGNSFVDGMNSFFGLQNSTFYGVSGIAASTMLTHSNFTLRETIENKDGETEQKKGTLAEALTERTGEFKKVYLVFGTNELGPKDGHQTAFYNAMCSLIDIVRATQPDAKIYILSTLPISQARSEESTSYNRDNALAFNTMMKRISFDKTVYYLDAFSLFADENGYLPEGFCMSDGIHILKAQYITLKTFIKTHTL